MAFNLATVTRKIVAAAVATHTQALYAVLRKADRKVDAAIASHEDAIDVSRLANEAKKAAAVAVAGAYNARDNIEQAVLAELDELPFYRG